MQNLHKTLGLSAQLPQNFCTHKTLRVRAQNSYQALVQRDDGDGDPVGPSRARVPRVLVLGGYDAHNAAPDD